MEECEEVGQADSPTGADTSAPPGLLKQQMSWILQHRPPNSTPPTFTVFHCGSGMTSVVQSAPTCSQLQVSLLHPPLQQPAD